MSAIVVLVTTEPDFLQHGGTVFERRGTVCYTARDSQVLQDVLTDVVPDLVVVNAVALPSDLKRVHEVLRTQTSEYETALMEIVNPTDVARVPAWVSERARTQVIYHPFEAREVLRDASVLAGWSTRRHTRVAVRVVVMMRKQVLTVEGFTRDLSKGGMGLETEAPLPVGEVGMCSFRLAEGGQELSMPATVLRSTPTDDVHLHGLRFLEPSFQQLAEITNFMNQAEDAEPE